jgi:hypothetical protein
LKTGVKPRAYGKASCFLIVTDGVVCYKRSRAKGALTASSGGMGPGPVRLVGTPLEFAIATAGEMIDGADGAGQRQGRTGD